eukprot:CAMPEP_0175125378 /NCGR_PEP_ID=MMETSP0087-20121206/3284_1 /TAXON_ID=136419 /ORGANISM="Unknown Unknown, Strain D1" /LENGTH=553 /DNA_ID=CAMNT_0016407211 /DNA_START=41 /DNA_END=1699 /DNA_ORIENTATION=+
MDFSEALPCSNTAKQSSKERWFSPDGRFLASKDKYRLYIREAFSLEIIQVITCLDMISLLQWSPDSTMLLCAQNKRNIVQIFSVHDTEWTCKIDEGLAGLSHACWAPDSRHVLTTTDFQLRTTVWSLLTANSSNTSSTSSNNPVGYIQFPKQTSSGLQFSHNGRYLAVVERRNFKDFVSVYCTEGWERIQHFEIDTEDCVGVLWSPDDRYVAVWGSMLEYRVCVYSAYGSHMTTFTAYEHALGVKCVEWSPSGRFLAVGSYDESVRVLNVINWQVIFEGVHSTPVKTDGVVVYTEEQDNASLAKHAEAELERKHASLQKDIFAAEEKLLSAGGSVLDEEDDLLLEEDSKHGTDKCSEEEAEFRKQLSSLKAMASQDTASAGNTDVAGGERGGGGGKGRRGRREHATRLPVSVSLNTTAVSESNQAAEDDDRMRFCPSRYAIDSVPSAIASTTPAADKPEPKLGVGLVRWSPDENFLATRNDNMPKAVWVWDMRRLALSSVLKQQHLARDFAWDPSRNRLLLAANTAKLYMWSPEGCSVVDVPGGDFVVRKLQW